MTKKVEQHFQAKLQSIPEMKVTHEVNLHGPWQADHF